MTEPGRSPIADRHIELGATLTDFAGFEMPLDYGSVVAEHTAVRTDCGVFDLSHLGMLVLRGPAAAEVLQATLTNDIAALPAGRAHYSLCLDADAGVVDDLLVYHLDWGYFVVPNAANVAAVRKALEEEAQGRDVEVVDVRGELACLAVQGPRSDEVMAMAGLDVSGLGYLDCRELDLPSTGPDAVGDQPSGPVAGVLARSGYTGERGYEIFCTADKAPTLWDRLVAADARPAGLGSRDTLRLEMGYPLHGQDLSVDTSPVEARLGWAVKPGTGFRGEEAYVRLREQGPARRLMGLSVTGRGVPRAHCLIRRGDAVVGDTTSGTFSPTLRRGIALGYLDSDVEAGEEVTIEVRGKALPAEVVRPPFVHADPKA